MIKKREIRNKFIKQTFSVLKIRKRLICVVNLMFKKMSISLKKNEFFVKISCQPKTKKNKGKKQTATLQNQTVLLCMRHNN